MQRHYLLFVGCCVLIVCGLGFIYLNNNAIAGTTAPVKNSHYTDFSSWYLKTYKVRKLPFRAAAVIDANTLAPLYFHQETTVMPTASLIKMITVGALLTYQPIWYTRNVLTVTEDEKLLRSYVGPKDNFSLLKIDEGDSITLEQALAATLIGSANNTAVALGEFIEVARPEFIERMREVAKQWGLKNTTVDEPSGLSLNNTSTAQDLSLATCNVFKDFVVSYYSSSPKASFTTEKGVKKTVLHTVRDLRQNPQNYFGGKTGYLTETQYHLAAGYITPQGHRVCLTILTSLTRADSENVARAMGLWLDQMYQWPQ